MSCCILYFTLQQEKHAQDDEDAVYTVEGDENDHKEDYFFSKEKYMSVNTVTDNLFVSGSVCLFWR